MNKWKWLFRILVLFLLVSLYWCYKCYVVQSQTISVAHRVPVVPSWQVLAHYCCTSRACQAHHREFRVVLALNGEYRWSD